MEPILPSPCHKHSWPGTTCHREPQPVPKQRPSPLAHKGANTRLSTAMSLMRMLSEGPEVSLRGSPTYFDSLCERVCVCFVVYFWGGRGASTWLCATDVGASNSAPPPK